MSTTEKRVVLWVAIAVLLVMTADYAPKLTIWFMALLVTSVVLSRASGVVALLQQFDKTATQ